MPVENHAHTFEFELRCRDKILTLGRTPSKAVVMGILNVTPDSFSDGGKYADVEHAVTRATAMVNEGATIIDVGGASSRPAGNTYGQGAAILDASVEIDRVVPVIREIRNRHPSQIISIDTFQAPVAAAAIEAGADIVNDITALEYSDTMSAVVRDTGAALILMHSPSLPDQLTHESDSYGDIVTDVETKLRERVTYVYREGISNVCIDPGFGFGKSMSGNYRLLNHLDAFLKFGLPILVGISRKVMIGIALGSKDTPRVIDERVGGSVAAAAVAVGKGASIIRTHDVSQTVDMLKVLAAVETEQVG